MSKVDRWLSGTVEGGLLDRREDGNESEVIVDDADDDGLKNNVEYGWETHPFIHIVAYGISV